MDAVLRQDHANPALGNGQLTDGTAAKRRAVFSSALVNSEGRRAGKPKQFLPPSMADSQKQLPPTGRPAQAQKAEASFVRQMRVAEYEINQAGTQQSEGRAHITGKMASESTSAPPCQ